MSDQYDILDRHIEATLAFRKDAATLFAPPTVTLYDQFGRPVYVPSTATKIGDTITVKRPLKFSDRS